MASGWAGDGAVQDQIQDSINDEVARARRGRRLSGALRAEASSIKPPIISGGAALCAGRAVSLRRPPSGRD